MTNNNAMNNSAYAFVRYSWCLLAFLLLTTSLGADEPDAVQAQKDASTVEVLLRLENFDINSSPPAKAALLRYLKANSGSEQYFSLIEKFELKDACGELVQLALARPTETTGVRAAELLARFGELKQLQKKVEADDEPTAVNAVTAIGYAAGPEAVEWLGKLLLRDELSVAVRAAAASGLGRNKNGEQTLLAMVEAGTLPADLNFTVANVLYASRDEEVRKRVAKHLQLPAAAAGQALPPLAELLKQRGDAAAGKTIFATKGTCIKCHKVAGKGKEVGPDLSEIGSKLSKEALYVSILNPSAGISHNYETHELVTSGGKIASGVLVSRTDVEVKLKNAEAIELTFRTDEVVELTKLSISLMPADLQRNLAAQELVDLVEYLSTLRKKAVD